MHKSMGQRGTCGGREIILRPLFCVGASGLGSVHRPQGDLPPARAFWPGRRPGPAPRRHDAEAGRCARRGHGMRLRFCPFPGEAGGAGERGSLLLPAPLATNSLPAAGLGGGRPRNTAFRRGLGTKPDLSGRAGAATAGHRHGPSHVQRAAAVVKLTCKCSGGGVRSLLLWRGVVVVVAFSTSLCRSWSCSRASLHHPAGLVRSSRLRMVSFTISAEVNSGDIDVTQPGEVLSVESPIDGVDRRDGRHRLRRLLGAPVQ